MNIRSSLYERASADPTPIVIALGTMHVVTSFILFNRHFTLRTFLTADLIYPPFVHGLLSWAAWLAEVPRYHALEAKVPLALWAFNFGSILLSLHHDVTARRVRTELLFLIYENFVIKLELLELFVCGFIHDLFQKCVIDSRLTIFLWTFQLVALAGLVNHIGIELFVTFFAKGVTAGFIS